MSEPLLARFPTLDVHQDRLHPDSEGTATSLEDERKSVRASPPVDCSETRDSVPQCKGYKADDQHPTWTERQDCGRWQAVSPRPEAPTGLEG